MIRIKHRFSGIVLLRVNARTLDAAHLSRAHLRGADLSGADLRGADLRGADLRRADLGSPGRSLGKEIGRVALVWLLVGFMSSNGLAVLQWSVLRFLSPSFHWLYPLLDPIAWFYAVTLVCVVMVFQALSRWRRALSAPVSLRGANLQGAQLRGAAMAGAKWEGAIYDRQTRWPKDFDPARHGAILSE